MSKALDDERIHRILSPTDDDPWRHDLERLERGDVTITRTTAAEEGIRALQRLMMFLGYSTTSSGGFSVDGDFGPGTNRGVAQFQFDHNLNPKITRQALCYECTFQTARRNIVAIPEARLDAETVTRMLDVAQAAIDANEVTFGDFDDAIFHLDAVDTRRGLSCREIDQRYGDEADAAVERLADERGVRMRREWILAIVRQETAGVVRPRFEQHKLSKFHARSPHTDLIELRIRSMSIGLGQIMGFNHKQVGAPSARAMLTSPADEQVLFVARFLAPKASIVAKENPTEDDFRAVARFYNGPAYERHRYHEKLEKWYRELRGLH